MELKKRLEKITSPDRVLFRGKIPAIYRFDALRPYRAYPGLRSSGYLPTFLVRPESNVEVSEIIRIARRTRTPVVPYGGGTGLMGAAIAVRGGIMIDFSGMNRIENISEENMLVRAQAGVILEDIYNHLDGHSLLFAHDPWTRPLATLGGAISTNSLGYLGAKYGSIGNQLLGLEAVLPSGNSLRTRPAQFSSTGLDLRRLFIGTEGTFGLVTSATVRAFPKPEKFSLASYRLRTFTQGYQAIMKIRACGVRPSMIDYGEDEPDVKSDIQLNLAFDGLEAEVRTHLSRADEIVNEVGGEKLDDNQAREFWEHRHDIALLYRRRIMKPSSNEEPATKFDYIHVSLPASKILDFRDETLRIAKARKVKILEVGLWQGPELFSIVLSSRAAKPETATYKLWDASNMILQHAQNLGGAMEFCHGVGLKLAHLMEREHGLGLELMRQLKEAVDPLGVMNPDKAAL